MKRSVKHLGAARKAVAAGARASARPIIARKLLAWYDRHRRILPWRALPQQVADPYHVWLSEVMLQQTTVGAVGPYYQKFLKRWPTVKSLAAADIDDVMREWAGLGYYRRARGLHECARIVASTHGGIFPRAHDALLELPGFGPYTAAAVTAIAFDGRANVVDGNVERVMARLFAVTEPLPKAKKQLVAFAEKLLPKARYGDYAQALMDLGATICIPRFPKCDLCPLSRECEARKQGIAAELPRRVKAKTKPVRRAIAFALFNDRGEILLRQRGDTGLLARMMEVPSSAWDEAAMPKLAAAAKSAPVKASWSMVEGMVLHTFTHFELELTVAVAKIKGRVASGVGKFVPLSRLDGEALPSVMRKVIRHAVAKRG